MQIAALIPNADILIALEPDELGLRMLLMLAQWDHRGGNTMELRRFLPSVVGDVRSRDYLGQYPSHRTQEIELALREAWAWLEGTGLLIEDPKWQPPTSARILSRRARQLAKEPDPRRTFSARRIPKDALHPKIREDVWALYHRGKYDTAVFEAMKAVEIEVRVGAGLTAKDIGVPLVRKAFDPNNGPLTDMEVEHSEREARAHLFAGAIGSYKNPQLHRHVALDDPDETAEIIMLANHLLRIVDARFIKTTLIG
jgi:uncharacterized protein (TIGR02391 family)